MQLVKYDLSKTFKLNLGAAVSATGFSETSAYTPKQNPHYVFRKETLIPLWIFIEEPSGDALFLTGPTGSGKTSLVTEYAARVNYPVQQVTAHGRMEMSDLVGFHVLKSANPGETPSMQWEDGPLTRAMRDGHILLINEIDLVDPSELGGLNDVLEGRPLVIAANGGEVINPHPAFRVIVTGNSFGQGDQTGLYTGIKTMNIASMDRYRMLEVGYPELDHELSILEKVVPGFPEPIRIGMVELANQIRSVFIGASDSTDATLSVTMSTRTLVRWAKLSQVLHNAGASRAISDALTQALLLRCSAEEQVAITKMASLIFGDTIFAN